MKFCLKLHINNLYVSSDFFNYRLSL